MRSSLIAALRGPSQPIGREITNSRTPFHGLTFHQQPLRSQAGPVFARHPGIAPAAWARLEWRDG